MLVAGLLTGLCQSWPCNQNQGNAAIHWTHPLAIHSWYVFSLVIYNRKPWEFWTTFETWIFIFVCFLRASLGGGLFQICLEFSPRSLAFHDPSWPTVIVFKWVETLKPPSSSWHIWCCVTCLCQVLAFKRWNLRFQDSGKIWAKDGWSTFPANTLAFRPQKMGGVLGWMPFHQGWVFLVFEPIFEVNSSVTQQKNKG